MKVHIINLDPEDDLASVRDKMTQAQAAKVVLVWPRRGRPLSSRLDLAIVSRHASVYGHQLGLVTYDPEVRTYASHVGLPVFETLEAVPPGDWNRSTAPSGAPARPDRLSLAELREARDKASIGTMVELPGQGRVAPFAIAVAAVLAIAIVVVPRAEVVIDPTAIMMEKRIDLWVDPLSPALGQLSSDVQAQTIEAHVGSERSRIPGQLHTVQVSGTQRLDTTGRLNLPHRAAEGEVEFGNLNPELVTVPAGTGLRAGEVRFLTIEPVDLDSGEGSIATAAIVAAEPGSAGNVAAEEIDAIEGPLGFLVSVSNPEATIGGENRLTDTVSAPDRRELRSRLEADLLEIARIELTAQLDRDQELVPGSHHITEVIVEQYDAQDGEPTGSLGLSMTVEVEALSYSAPTALAAAERAISSTLPAGRVLIPNSLSIEASDSSPDWPAIEVTFVAEGSLAKSIDADKVRGQILGGEKSKAGELLAETFELPEPPSIETWPPWLPWVPWLGMQVDVRWSWETA